MSFLTAYTYIVIEDAGKTIRLSISIRPAYATVSKTLITHNIDLYYHQQSI